MSENLPCEAELDTIGRNRTPSKVWVADDRMSLGDMTSHGDSIREGIAELEVGEFDEKRGGWREPRLRITKRKGPILKLNCDFD